MNEEKYKCPVCHDCHTHITDHAAWAFQNGFRIRINYRDGGRLPDLPQKETIPEEKEPVF